MKKHRVVELYRNQTTTVVAVFSVNVDVIKLISSVVCYASIKPQFTVICEDQTHKAIDMQAQPIPLNQLYQQVPELQQYL